MARETGASRKRIIAAARALLAEVGYEGFTMRKLAERLDLTAPAAYMHFADKDELLRAALDEEFAEAAQGWFAAHPPGPEAGSLSRLRRLVHFYLAMGLGNPVSYRIRFFHDGGADAQLRRWARGEFAEGDNARHLRAALAAWLEESGRGGEGELNRRFLEVWGMMHGLILAFAPVELPLEDKIEAALGAVSTYLEAINA